MPTQPNSGRKPKATSPYVPKKATGPAKPPKKSVRVSSKKAVKVTGPTQREVLAQLRKEVGLSIRLFSRLTGFSERAIAGWEGGAPVSEPARRRLLEVERFRSRLAEVVRPEAIPEWLDTPNEAFEGLKPVEVIERGEIDRLWNMIFYLESGVAS